jgi:penicillin-binding protein activator
MSETQGGIMFRKQILAGILLMFIILFFSACASHRVVTRTNPDTTIDLSGRWNDVDSREVAEEMVKDVTRRPWLTDFIMKEGRKPVVIVGTIRNLSDEHIETGTFQSDIERELINGGNVKFVASRGERKEVRDEKMDQQNNASEETYKKIAQEVGADFMLQGSIKTLIDAIDGKQVKYYQVDMQLINVETNEKVWIGTKKIKKLVSQSGTKW